MNVAQQSRLTIRIDYRFAGVDPALFKTHAAELIGMSPDTILAGSTPSTVALWQQTRTIPIAFVLVGDPVGQGFVQSLAHPGGNISGFTSPDLTMVGKWLQLLKEIAPGTTRVAVLFNPETAPRAALLDRALEGAGPSLGITVVLAPVRNDTEIEETVAALAREPGAALAAVPIGLNDNARRGVLIASASRYQLPLIGGCQFAVGAGTDDALHVGEGFIGAAGLSATLAAIRRKPLSDRTEPGKVDQSLKALFAAGLFSQGDTVAKGDRIVGQGQVMRTLFTSAGLPDFDRAGHAVVPRSHGE